MGEQQVCEKVGWASGLRVVLSDWRTEKGQKRGAQGLLCPAERLDLS